MRRIRAVCCARAASGYAAAALPCCRSRRRALPRAYHGILHRRPGTSRNDRRYDGRTAAMTALNQQRELTKPSFTVSPALLVPVLAVGFAALIGLALIAMIGVGTERDRGVCRWHGRLALCHGRVDQPQHRLCAGWFWVRARQPRQSHQRRRRRTDRGRRHRCDGGGALRSCQWPAARSVIHSSDASCCCRRCMGCARSGDEGSRRAPTR
jgi:hypothetical protein